MAPYTKEERQFLAKLQVYFPEDVFIFPEEGFKSGFKINPPQWFILKKNQTYYLIDTEGFTYVRYAGKLTGI